MQHVFIPSKSSIIPESASSFPTPHQCVSYNGLSERCRFCKECGLYMASALAVQRNQPCARFHRSRRFAIKDPTCSNSNAILEQMIARQSANRYFNIAAQSLHQRAALVEWMQSVSQNLQ